MDNRESTLDENMFKERLTENKINEELGTNEIKKKKYIIIGSVIAIIIIIVIILAITLNKDDEEEEEKKEETKKEDYDPIPKNEDLNFTEEEHRLFSRQAATQGMVLATNNDILPIKTTDLVVLFGLGTNNTVYGGSGSGEVYIKGTTTNINPVQILDGIENKGKENKFHYRVNNKGYEIGERGLTDDDIKNFAQKDSSDKRSIAVLTISRRSGEGSDRPQDKSFTGTLLTDAEIQTYESLKSHFDNIVIVLNVGSVMELQGIEKDTKTSILIAFLPGMEAGNAIADVLVGDVNPSGRLTDTWASKIDDYPSTSTFVESYLYVKYKEGLFVGYRYFEDDEEKQKKVIFPFGFGLSYTTFSVVNKCNFDETKRIFTIESTVTNTGKRTGKHVVQVYAQKPQNENFIKAQRELVAFAKTKDLQPGSTEILTMSFNLTYLASYDDTGIVGHKGCYVLEKGEYNIYVGNSVADVRGDNNKIYTYKQETLEVTERYTTRVQPKDPDVAEANKKPDFNSFMKKENKIKEENKNKNKEENKPFVKKSISSNQNQEDYYINTPTTNLNEINFKTVLQKRYTMEQLVDSMTNEELAFVSYGHGANIRHGTGTIGGLYNAGVTGKYYIPSGDTNDGPAGLRHSEDKMASTAWPCSTALASSFDVNLLEKIGQETGKEARKIGSSFWLAPGMNIHRSPLCGRNFEYYSEDPLITGKMAAAITKGIQSKRVSITLKHFAVNNKEKNRNGEDSPEGLALDSRMAERVAREIYLKGFEIAVKEGNPWSIMSSYNRFNGMKTAESYDLLTGILREEWGYEGIVMTDWGSNSHHDRETHAGNDVKMNTNNDGTATILEGIKSGLISRDELKRNVLKIFNTLSKTAAIDRLFETSQPIEIKDGFNKIKIYDNIYYRSEGISYQPCDDIDGGYNPTTTTKNSFISLWIKNKRAGYRNVKVRYSGLYTGFGVSFKANGKNLGEITNLEKTGEWQHWETSPPISVYFPEGTYELVLHFLSYDYKDLDPTKGNINWIEIE